MKIFKTYTLRFFLVFLFIAGCLHAQEVKVENVRFNIEEGKIVVYYDIVGEKGEEYEISMFLRNDDDPEYRYEPDLVSGDIGDVEDLGIDRKIIWDVQKEFPEGLEGESFYFEVIAEESGGLAWYYYVGGAVVGLIVVGAATKSDEPANGGDTVPTVAEPPGRPGGLR